MHAPAELPPAAADWQAVTTKHGVVVSMACLLMVLAELGLQSCHYSIALRGEWGRLQRLGDKGQSLL